ncbi:SAM-dependent methyltransferase [Brevundimonas sp. LM2]|uniref:class I SAM-dependent methyltransferase n=1 Tax=Brevundimonas sp. LM2 TaxID=1938605 RepID=UPI000983B10B|nr:class I SAM-dependent methyltransferase [Brevundimonas sp. LM2]AQR60877.1 SAM-dependent methyltransferase [Brevundimonas sp. LM2]
MHGIAKHSLESYKRLVANKLSEHPKNRDLALAQSIGSTNMELFAIQGDGHVEVLRHHGLIDGMDLYDLGCGSGRTAQALQRSGWRGQYTGADIVDDLVLHVQKKCPGFKAIIHHGLTIAAPDASLDIVFHWSVFTHLLPEECFAYLSDTYRALRPGGKTVFSFLEYEDAEHRNLFIVRSKAMASGDQLDHLDTFLPRSWISSWAEVIGFEGPQFTSGSDVSHHAAFWQSIVSMRKPA